MNEYEPSYGADSGGGVNLDEQSLFVVRLWDGVYPARVAIIIPAKTRYEAEIRAEEWFEEVKDVKLGETDLEVAEAMEDDHYPGVFKI